MSETTSKETGPDPDDLPNDFFDDFSKAEFIEGLSVIDSWDDDDNSKRKTSKIDKAAVDSVQDLRELIQNSDAPDKEGNKSSKNNQPEKSEPKKKKIEDKAAEKKPPTNHEMDSYIRPGSRRDPNKTNEAIRRDKQEKVKEHLAKSLDNVKPPGTELDDFCEDTTLLHKKSPPKRSQDQKPHDSGKNIEESRYVEEQRRLNEGRRFEEPRRHEEHKRFEDRTAFKDRRNRESPLRSRFVMSPLRRRYSPVRRFSPRRHSPYRRSPHWRSPERRRSPDRRLSPGSRRRSSDRKQSPDIRHKKDYRTKDSDNFLYPKNPSVPTQPYIPTNAPSYPTPPRNSVPSWEPNPVKVTAYNYGAPVRQAVPVYPTSYPATYEYATQPGPPGIDALAAPYAVPPQAVPAPALLSGPSILGPVPTMVPAPVLTSSVSNYSQQIDTTIPNQKSPFNALAQLVAEGKISKEDYQKLAPNKGTAPNTGIVDLSDKVQLISRCQDAVGKLSKLRLPNRLIVLQNIPNQEPKTITSKYCSPLKRQPMVEFQFTQPNPTTLANQNKVLIDNIAIALGFDKFLNKPDKKETKKTTKDASVQTSRPYCDVCEIRESTKCYDAGTSTMHEYFTSSVHTQVLDEDMASSKSLFTASGGAPDRAPMSIAHLTPAQLVSQLAARAKTLKQNDPAPESYSQYGRREAPNNHDYNRGGNDYNNHGYRY